MSLSMFGHIDDVFISVVAERTSRTGSYVNGIWVDGAANVTSHDVTIQPASDREIDSIERGGERVVDARKIYVNDGIDASIRPTDVWEFEGQKWKCHRLDNRPWRNYCRAVVYRIDNQ
jgi:hypothetical protein